MTRHRYRFFAVGVADGVAALSDADEHHLRTVLRMAPGDECDVVAGGVAHRARLGARGLELGEPLPAPPAPPPLTVWIAQPGARSDAAVEKLTELGVERIGALASALLKGSWSEARLDRWRRVAQAAAKQSRRADVPAIAGPAAYADVLSPDAIVLSHERASGGLGDRLVGRRSATLLIGPEPGFADAELDLAREHGVAVATFGPVVLRTETAAVVAAALAMRELGFLG